MRHAIVIRLKYNDGPEFDWRLAFFQSVCLRSLLKQKDQNFDIVVLCNPEHSEILKALSDKIKTIHHEVPISGDSNYVRKGEKNSVMPFEFELDYEIQTRLDSDDIVSDGFTEKIHKLFKGHKKPHLLCFKPMRFNLDTLRLYHTYDNYRSSMFLSVFNPKKNTFIYEVGHGFWAKKIKRMGGDFSIVKFGYCFQMIHGHNASTGIRPKDRLV
jgi:hypothetical protein